MSDISIIQKTSAVNTSSAMGRTISYIVIHYTAGTSSKKNSAVDNASWFNNSQAKASADFIVDDALIVQKNPDIKNRYCWAVGGSKYSNCSTTGGGKYYGKCTNKNCISIEICSNNDTGKITNANDSHYYFTDASIANAVKLTKYLMAEYGIDADHVIRHFDVTGKPCPGVKRGSSWGTDGGSAPAWEAFKKSISSSTSTTTSTTSNTTSASTSTASSSGSFQVRTNTAMNVRKGPGTSYAITMVAQAGVYTITKTNGGAWGYLKSGAGWINISSKYATRL